MGNVFLCYLNYRNCFWKWARVSLFPLSFPAAACVAPWNTFHNLLASIGGVLHWKRKEEVSVLIYPPTHTYALWPLSISLSAFLCGTAVCSAWQLPLIRCWWKTQFPRAHCSSAVHPCAWPAGVRPAWHLESAALMCLSCCVTLSEAMQRRPYWYPRRRAEINRPLLCCVCVSLSPHPFFCQQQGFRKPAIPHFSGRYSEFEK